MFSGMSFLININLREQVFPLTHYPGQVLLFSLQVVSDSLWPHKLQLPRLPWACSNCCPSSRWCRPTISSSVACFSSCAQSFPTLGSFQMHWLFASGDQSIGVSASVSALPMNIQDWFPLGLTGLISCSPRDSQKSSPTPQFKSIRSSVLSLLHSPTLTSIHDHRKNHSLD